MTAKTTTITKTVEVHNYSSKTRTYAIKLDLPLRERQGQRRGQGHDALEHHGALAQDPLVQGHDDDHGLQASRRGSMDSGSNALNAAVLDLQEYDGYVWLNDTSTSSDNAKKLHLAWHVLPRQSGSISTTPNPVAIDGTVEGPGFDGGAFDGAPAGTVTVKNAGIGVGAVDTYSLVGTSPDLPTARRGTNTPIIDLKAVGVQTFPVPADFCSDDGLVRLRHRRQHLGAPQHHRCRAR